MRELVAPTVLRHLQRLAHAVATQLAEGLQWRRDEAQLRGERRAAWEEKLRGVLRQLEAETPAQLLAGEDDEEAGVVSAEPGTKWPSFDNLVNTLASKRQMVRNPSASRNWILWTLVEPN